MTNDCFNVLISFLFIIQMTVSVGAEVNIIATLDACLSRHKELLPQVASTGGVPEKCEYLSPVFTCQLGAQPSATDAGRIKAVKDGAARLVGSQGACDVTIDAIVDSAGDFQMLSTSQGNALICWRSFQERVNDTQTSDVICDGVRNFSKCVVLTYGSHRPSPEVIREAKAAMSDLGQRTSSRECNVDIDTIMNEVWGNSASDFVSRTYVIVGFFFSYFILVIL